MSMSRDKFQIGFNLIELMIVLALCAILINIGLPGISRLVESSQGRLIINEINRAIALSRHTAINNGVITTLCRSSNLTSCGGQWHEGFIVFTDRNADRIINGNDRLIRVFPPIITSGSLKFRSFQNKQYLQMTAQGFTNYQNGNFTYCPENNDSSLAQRLIINRSGRTYFSQDSDGDGLKEGADGKAIVCN